MLRLRWCIFVIINTLGTAQILHKGYFLVVRQLECVGNPEYFSQAICQPIAPRNRSVNAAVNLMRNITSITATLEVSIPNKRHKMTKIYEITFELCKLLRERKRKNLIELLVAITRTGNLKMQCPFLAGKYHVKNITVVEALPPVLSESDFFIRFNFYVPRVATILNVTALGHLYDVAKEQTRKKKYL